MTLMVVLLLAMNLVLAAGLGMLWMRSHMWCEKSMDLEQRLQGRMYELEGRIHELETRETVQGFAPEGNISWIKDRLQTKEGVQAVPERYRLAMNMAGTGMDLQEVSETIGISPHEAKQLTSLAQLARTSQIGHTSPTDATKEWEPE